MNSWNCCRLCLKESSLNPIFSIPEHCMKYTEIILRTTGVTVQLNDSLPQEMCSECIEQINNMNKFRKQCILSEQTLIEQKSSFITFSDTHVQKSEPETYYASIDITEYNTHHQDKQKELINSCDDICDVPKIESKTYDSDQHDLDDEPLTYIFNKTKRKKGNSAIDGKLRSRKAKLKDETNIENKSKERVREEIKCEYCPKILTSKLSLRNHYKIHTGFDIVCEHCGKKFITKRLLLMHCRAKHGYEKTDKCSFCDYTAANAEQVKIHERLHTGERPFVCQQCNAGFHRKSSYLQHVAIHLPEKTVQCDQCPARFKSVTLMRIHRHRHRPPTYTFKCYICDSSFARRRNVLRHLSRIHAVVEASQPVERIRIS